MGLQLIVKRQLLARTDLSDDFVALDGIIMENSGLASTSTIQIVKYVNTWSKPKEFVVEYHEYGRALKHTTDLDNKRAIQELRAPVRKLT